MSKKNRPHNLERKVLSFIREHDLAPEGVMLVAVSGGADSICLLHTLSRWQKELGVRLHVAHLNHQLRGAESDADAQYVSDLTQQLDLPATIESCDVKSYRAEKHCSLEEAAREVRYSFLSRVAREIGAKRAAVGHTRDDHVETILMHLIRGTGLTGLQGLQPWVEMTVETGERLEIVRPLLTVTRQEITDYCHRHRLMPRTDSSNQSLSALRNRIRLELLPLLRKYNPNVDEVLCRLSEIAGDELSFVEGQVRQLWSMVRQEGDAFYLDKTRFRVLPRALQRQLLRSTISRLVGGLKNIEANHIEAILSLTRKPVGKTLNLPHGLLVATDYNGLILKQGEVLTSHLPFIDREYELNIPGETVLSGWRVVTSIVPKPEPVRNNNFAACFDLGKVGRKLLVRKRRPGDRFQPSGMKELKKLQDFMVDAKVPRAWRERVPLVCSSEHILWVVGWRTDERAKVTNTTKEVLQIEFEPLY